MPDHPGAAANQTDPASSTMADKGYASPDSTIAANEDQSPSAGAEAANELGTSPNDSTMSSGTSSQTSSDTGYAGSTTGSATTSGTSAKSAGTGSSTSSTSTASTQSARGSLAGMTADDLVNKRVKTADGEDVGEIDSIVTDKMSQAHGYAVIGVGGVLGVGEKKVLVDLDQLQLTADGDIRTPVSSEHDFDSYPTYDEKNFDKYDGDISRLL
jgi:sporulation protein YlmC with PRC-barrel domain